MNECKECEHLKAENARLAAMHDAVVELCAFCKQNGFPEKLTPEFFRLTELVDKLDTAERRVRSASTQRSMGNWPIPD